MQRIPYTYRRGATYYWRRRFDAPSGAFELNLSLRVNEQKKARPLSSKLTIASEALTVKIARGEMNKAEAGQYMSSLLDRQVAWGSLGVIGEASSQERRTDYLCEGWSQYLTAIGGKSVSVTPEIAQTIIAYGGGPELVRAVGAELLTFRTYSLGGEWGYELFARHMERALGRQLGTQESEIARQIHLRTQAVHSFGQAMQFELPDSKLAELIVKICDLSGLFPYDRDVPFGRIRPMPYHTPLPEPQWHNDLAAIEYAEALRLYNLDVAMQKRENEDLTDVNRHPSRAKLTELAEFEFQVVLGRRALEAVQPPATITLIADDANSPRNTSDERHHIRRELAAAQIQPDGSPVGILDFTEVVLNKHKIGESNPITEKTEEQTRKVMAFFMEATGRDYIYQITQKDIARFKKVMQSLPPTYRKSPRDRKKTLEQIIDDTVALKISRDASNGKPVKIGLSASTINRNLTIVGKIIKHATAGGEEINLRLNPGLLRMKKTTTDNEDRPAFTQLDVERIFKHPVWQGHWTPVRRNVAGTNLVKDALYWLPLMAVYTGCRLEEMAGLKLDDVVLSHEVPHFDIKINSNRRLKNPQSKRLVPIHPVLLQLGLADYIKAIQREGQTDLFPDAKPVHLATFGGKIDAPFRAIVDQQLASDARIDGIRKTFHSFRHYFAGAIEAKLFAHQIIKKDILGHLHEDITDGVYGKVGPLPKKLAMLKKLPEIETITQLIISSEKRHHVASSKPRPTLKLRKPRVKKLGSA